MASNCTASATVKPTFAKVAASSYLPPAPNKHNPSKNTSSPPAVSLSVPQPQTQTQTRPQPQQQPSSTALKVSPDLGKAPVKIPDDNEHPVHEGIRGGDDQTAPASREAITRHAAEKLGGLEVEAAQQSLQPSSSRPPHADDGSTQLSSSDGSLKQPGFDNKSVASVATFALDEKDSVRPDDSASIRAVEEEDTFSAPGTGPAGSRVGSDSGARAFRDQLHQISVMGAMASRAAAPERYQPQAILKPGMPFDGVVTTQPPVAPQALAINGILLPVPSSIDKMAPDEKLLEALASHRDRLFVLKLEQDLIDFIQNSKEVQLDLPQTHSFYRMLAHKLADYFLLDHAAKQHEGGTSITIRKTQVCRLPPPLSTFSVPLTNASTPPPTVQARKIMRRGDDPTTSGTSTSVNSEGPSKATSEVGDGSGASDAGVKATPSGGHKKANMTREEREAKYKEARERIFGNTEEIENKDVENKSEGNDISRSSSAAGKKKARKRTPITDDDFQPRSQFPGPQSVFPSQYGQGGYAADGIFYPQYPQPMQHQQYAGLNGAQLPYGSVYPSIQQQDQQVSYGYQPQQMAGAMPYPGADGVNYDLAMQFQRGMQSLQNANSSPQAQPQLASPQPAYQGQFSPQLPVQQQMPPQQQSFAQTWQPPIAFNSTFTYGQPNYLQPQYPDRPMSSPGQLTAPPYPFASPPTMAFQNGQAAYNRVSLNPQTLPFAALSNRAGMGAPPQMGTFTGKTIPNAMPMSQRNISSGSYSGGYNSPRPVPGTIDGATSAHGQSNIMVSSGSNGQPVQPQAQLQPQTLTSPASQHSLPERPMPDSSIAKWGTPSHLPAKPPPPASMEPLKYNELHKGVQGLPGLPKYMGNDTDE